jgi:class 3 adenylate cyclase
MSIEEQSTSTSPGRIERKLAAILSADVKGYSRLMGEDEVATIRMLSAYREMMSTLIRQYRCVCDVSGNPQFCRTAAGSN